MNTDETIAALAAAVVEAAAAAGHTLATAESCTGGWIAKSLTDIPGSSAAFGYGIVSYSNAAKESLLGVSAATLERFGAVSGETVREMAEGILRLSGAGVAIAVSGIAGPEGGTADKPVGTVWFGWAAKQGNTVTSRAERRQFEGDRAAVRARAVIAGLEGLRDCIEEI